MTLRDFQQSVEDKAFQLWAEPNIFNLQPVLPTGGGKTVLIASVTARMDVPTCAIAHRQELVSQMSLAFNREKVPHAILAPKKVQQQIIRLHHETHGYSRYSYRSDVRVAGVDTLANHDKKDRWLSNVGLVIQDEGHHVLQENKWGRAMALFPNARGFFPTAHSLRADGLGLGRSGSGLVDRLILGPSCRDLITRGFLTDYDVYCPESDINFSEVEISPITGEYKQRELRNVTHRSKRLVGDVVENYLRYAAGKLGVTFAVDIEEAQKLASAYQAAGVPAQVITSKTPIDVRAKLMRQFRERLLLQLVSVDCLGEGVDVPAIEVVSLARLTASFQLYAQHIGRALRVMVESQYADFWGTYSDEARLRIIAASAKPKAIIIDHVGNTIHFAPFHGRVCSRQSYSLDDAPVKTRNGLDELRICIQCAKPYERYYTECPYCGYTPEVGSRQLVEHVDGDLTLLDPAVLEGMRIRVAKIDAPAMPYPGAVGGAIQKNHYNRQRQQVILRHAIDLWGGWRKHVGDTSRMADKLFYLTFGIDGLSAKALGMPEAIKLESKIQAELYKHNVVDRTRS
jgi:DNA repair protein RadD